MGTYIYIKVRYSFNMLRFFTKLCLTNYIYTHCRVRELILIFPSFYVICIRSYDYFGIMYQNKHEYEQ